MRPVLLPFNPAAQGFRDRVVKWGKGGEEGQRRKSGRESQRLTMRNVWCLRTWEKSCSKVPFLSNRKGLNESCIYREVGSWERRRWGRRAGE